MTQKTQHNHHSSTNLNALSKLRKKKIVLTPKKRLHLLILKQMLTLATGGFGLVAALAWNGVILEFVTTKIKPFLPQGGLISLGIYAVIVTTIAVVVTYQLTTLIDKLEG